MKWLEAHVGHERVFGIGGVFPANTLLPNRIRDIRHLDAMYPSLYIDYISAIWPFARQTVYAPNQSELKVSTDPLLDLAAVRYVLAPTGEPPETSSIFDDIIRGAEAAAEGSGEGIKATVFEMAGEPRRVLLQPLSRSFSFPIKIPPHAHLTFGVGDDRQWAGVVDGTRFELTVQERDAPELKLLDRSVYLPRDSSERHWTDADVDLTSYGGREVTLVFRISPLRDGGGAPARAGWTGLYFDFGRPQLVEVYRDSDVIIYRNEKAVPRARFVSTALSMPPDLTPAALKNQAAHFRDVVMLDGNEETSKTSECIKALASKIEYLTDDPDSVTLSLDAPCPGFVVLADVFYPGWQAFVDGQATKIFRANYAFRAIKVDSGTHMIEFQYSPLTTEIGIPIALLTIFGLGAGFAYAGYALIASRYRRFQNRALS